MISRILVLALQVASLTFVARAVLSWFPIRRDSRLEPFRAFVFAVTEPVLAPLRRALPQIGSVDVSVFVVVVFISLVLTPLASAL